MTIMTSKNGKVIKVSMTDTIEFLDKATSYKPELPQVICNDLEDAKYIQQEVNTFVHRLSNEILND